MPLELREFSLNMMGEEANILFTEPIFSDVDLTQNFRVIPNVISKKKIAFAQELEKIVRTYSGCGFMPLGSARLYERWIEVDRAKVDLTICWEEFRDTFYEELLKKGTAIADLTGTVLMNMVETMVRGAIKKDILRLAWFGNKADTDPAYSVTDGLWTVILPAFVTANQTPYYNTSSGSALSSGDGIEILRTLYDNQDVRLKALPKGMKKFYVSTTVADQYRDDLENGGGADAGITMLQDGSEVLRFRGIEVVEMLSWNEIMASDFASANAHLAILTTPQNLVLATDVADAEAQLKIWFNEETEMNNIKARWKMGFNVIHPTLMSVGY